MKLQENENDIILEYEKGNSAITIGKQYGVDYSVIIRILKKNNISLRDQSLRRRKFLINDDFFAEINTEEKAYFLGLIYADGYVNEKRNYLRLALKSNDVDILIKFRDAIYDNKDKRLIVSRKKNCNDLLCVDVSSKKIVEDLKKLGVIQAKTFSITFPNKDQVSKHLISHFMRGYFDGDGCITFSEVCKKHKDKIYKQINNKFEIIGTKEFCSVFFQCLDIKFSTTKIGAKNIIRATNSSFNSIKKIFSFLYNDSNIFLQRKKEKFNNLILIKNE